MTDDRMDNEIRRAIGGDPTAIAWIREAADRSTDAVLIVMAALLERDAGRLERAGAVAVTSRDRQVVSIASAHLGGDDRLVDAMARDHLVDHPDSLIVSWIASDAVERSRRVDPA